MSLIEEALPGIPRDPRPVLYDGHVWHVFRYSDVQQIIRTVEASQDYPMPTLTAPEPHRTHPTFYAMWSREGQAHDDLRGLVREPFSPRVLQGLEPVIAREASDLLAALHASGSSEIEMMSAFARPFAARVICRLLGIDPAYAVQFDTWAREAAAISSLDQVPEQPELVACFEQVLAESRKQPGLGLVSRLLEAEHSGTTIAGEPLSEQDLLGYLFSFLFAGTETTSTALGQALLFFDEFGLLEQLRANRGLIPGAIEETLRWQPSFPCVLLWASRKLQIGKVEIKPGQQILAWLSAANRDPDVFGKDAQEFKINRDPNPHLSFGWGRHRCLGEPLAQLELEVALNALLDSFPLPIRRIGKPVYQLGIVNMLLTAYFAIPGLHR